MSSPLRILLCIAALCVTCFGQQAANATLTGTITDPHGAVVSGANITATLRATGIKRETVSNDDGLYVLSNMAPGEYDLRVEAKGFSTKASKTAVSLKVGQTVTQNVPLEISVNESVVVDMETRRQLIDNNDSLIHGIVDSREVESLPLNGRNFLELALLVPGN